MALIDEVKTYCRADEDLTDLVESAKLYLTNAGVKANEENVLYCLAVKMLVEHWYDHRGVIAVGTITKRFENGFGAIIEQLKWGG